MCHLPSPFFHGRLRSKQIESACFSGTAAFMEVRIQSVVVEFILNHVDVLFSTKLSTLIREGAGTYRHQTDKYSSFITHCFFYITCVAVLPHYQVTTHCHGPSHCWFHRLPLNFWVWRRPRPGLRLRSTLLSLKTASTLRWAKVQLPCRANSTQSSSFPLKGLLTLYYVVIKTLTDCTYLKNVSYRTRNNIAAMCHPLLVTCKTASVWFPDTASNFGKKWIQSYFTHRVCISKDPLFRFLHKLTELFFSLIGRDLLLNQRSLLWVVGVHSLIWASLPPCLSVSCTAIPVNLMNWKLWLLLVSLSFTGEMKTVLLVQWEGHDDYWDLFLNMFQEAEETQQHWDQLKVRSRWVLCTMWKVIILVSRRPFQDVSDYI